MEDKTLWATFEKTGSVVDYLNYKHSYTPAEKDKMGESAVESRSKGYRDDTVRNTNR